MEHGLKVPEIVGIIGSAWKCAKMCEGLGIDVMITMDFGISPGCYQVEGVKTLNYSGNSVVK